LRLLVSRRVDRARRSALHWLLRWLSRCACRAVRLLFRASRSEECFRFHFNCQPDRHCSLCKQPTDVV